jgi:predicted transcriptional regulator
MESGPAPRELAAPAEWQVFAQVCRLGPVTIRQLARELYPERQEADHRYPTLLTFAQRLVKKGYLTLTPPAGPARGRTSAGLYTAAIDYSVALGWQVERFLAQYALGGREDLVAVRAAVEQLAAVRSEREA